MSPPPRRLPSHPAHSHACAALGPTSGTAGGTDHGVPRLPGSPASPPGQAQAPLGSGRPSRGTRHSQVGLGLPGRLSPRSRGRASAHSVTRDWRLAAGTGCSLCHPSPLSSCPEVGGGEVFPTAQGSCAQLSSLGRSRGLQTWLPTWPGAAAWRPTPVCGSQLRPPGQSQAPTCMEHLDPLPHAATLSLPPEPWVPCLPPAGPSLRCSSIPSPSVQTPGVRRGLGRREGGGAMPRPGRASSNSADSRCPPARPRISLSLSVLTHTNGFAGPALGWSASWGRVGPAPVSVPKGAAGSWGLSDPSTASMWLVTLLRERKLNLAVRRPTWASLQPPRKACRGSRPTAPAGQCRTAGGSGAGEPGPHEGTPV